MSIKNNPIYKFLARTYKFLRNIYRYFRDKYEMSINETFHQLLLSRFDANQNLNFNLAELSETERSTLIAIAPPLLKRPTFQFIPAILGLKNLTFTLDKNADFCLLWGTKATYHNYKILKFAAKYQKPILICEDAFLRSKDIAVKGSPGLSCLMDRFGIYYSAEIGGDIAQLLNDKNWSLTPEQLEQSKQSIDAIKQYKVSKYNMVAPSEIDLGAPDRPKILLIDQRYGDQSIAAANAGPHDFKRMLDDAIAENPTADIFVKTHPDANDGGFWGYFSDLKRRKLPDNVHLLTDNLNPISLLSKIDKIYVVCSQMGFEGLICGAEVNCYGAPFYSGWGLTNDRGRTPERQHQRSLEEVFYAAYIHFAKYCTHQGVPCDIFTVIKELSPLAPEENHAP